MKDKNKATGELIEGHQYDGIQELDHPLPKWWVYLFYGTIIFSIGYYSYYTFLGGPSHKKQYETAMVKIYKKAENAKAEVAVVDESDVVNVEELLKDTEALKVGEETFKQTCAACHGQKGEGVIGPNLTDKHWISSKGDYDGVLKAILEGFPSKGMPPWKDVVPKNKHAPLAAFVLSLQGTNPSNAKAPQGELVP